MEYLSDEMSTNSLNEIIKMLVKEALLEEMPKKQTLGEGITRLLEGKIEQAIEKNKNNPELVRFLQFAKEKGLLPKYVDLAIKGWNERTETFDYKADMILRIIDEFEGKLFQHLVPIDKKDIGKYKTWNDFQRFVVSDLRQIANTHYREKDKEKKAKQGGKRIYEDETYLVLEPKTKEASCTYGKGSKWCISATGEDTVNYFEDYSSKGARFLFLINKKTNDKDAIAFAGDIEDVEIYDARDNNKDEKYLTKKYPSNVLEAVNQFLEPIIGRTLLIINYEELYNNPLSFMSWDNPNKIYNLDGDNPETFKFLEILASTMPENPQMRGKWMEVVDKLLMKVVMSVNLSQGMALGQKMFYILRKDPIGANWSLPAVPEKMVLLYALLNDMNARYHGGVSATLKVAALCAAFMPVGTNRILSSVDLDALENSNTNNANTILNVRNQLAVEAGNKVPTKLMPLFESVLPSYAPSGDVLNTLIVIKTFFQSLNITSIENVINHLNSSM